MANYTNVCETKEEQEDAIVAVNRWLSDGIRVVATREWEDDHEVCLTLTMSNGNNFEWWVSVGRLVMGYGVKKSVLEVLLDQLNEELDNFWRKEQNDE
jgi:hypothetical protein